MELSDLTCKELVELVTDYIENMLSPEDRRRFESHLSGCEGCRNYLAQMEKTIRMVGKLSEKDIVPPARDQFLKAFRTWKADAS